MLLAEGVEGLLLGRVPIVMWSNGEGKQGSGYISWARSFSVATVAFLKLSPALMSDAHSLEAVTC